MKEPEEDEEETIRVYHLNDEKSQIYVVTADETSEKVVLVNYMLGVGFAIPPNYAYQLAHMILDSVATVRGDSIDAEIPKNQTFH